MKQVAALSALGDRTFGSLRRHRNYRLYFAGSGISFIGTWMQQIAAYWLVLQLTGSPIAVGALALVQTLPVTVLALVGGTIADRVNLRRLVVVCESVLAASAVTLAVLALTGLIEVWQLYVLGLVQGIALALDAPARHTLVFQIVGRADLPNAVALSSALGTSARVIGPALGGLVVAVAGAGIAFAFNAVSYVIVIAAILAMRLDAQPSHSASPPRVLVGVGEAITFIWSSRRVAITFLTVLLVSTFSFNFDVMLPLVARLTLDRGATTFGLIASVFGAGALCGALTLATIGRAKLVLVLVGAAGFGGFQLLLARQDTLPTVCAVLFVIGIFYAIWGSSALATLQLSAPDHMRGRAASLYFFAFMGGAPLGGLLSGSLTAHGGTRLAFTVAGVVAVVVATLGALILIVGRSSRTPASGPAGSSSRPSAGNLT
ncbi:MAG: MFS transporter [Thermoleophilia bacterium]